MPDVYLVTLKNGASLWAQYYYEDSDHSYEFKIYGEKGIYPHSCPKDEVEDIQLLTKEDIEKYPKETQEYLWYLVHKTHHYLDSSYSMYDMCHCVANCKKDCARKKKPEGICTVSDFSKSCIDYEEDK